MIVPGFLHPTKSDESAVTSTQERAGLYPLPRSGRAPQRLSGLRASPNRGLSHFNRYTSVDRGTRAALVWILSGALACTSQAADTTTLESDREGKQTLAGEALLVANIVFLTLTGVTLLQVFNQAGQLRAVPTARRNILGDLSRLLLRGVTTHTVTNQRDFDATMRTLQRQHGNPQLPPVLGTPGERCYVASTSREEVFFEGNARAGTLQEKRYVGSFLASTSNPQFFEDALEGAPSTLVRTVIMGCETISTFFRKSDWRIQQNGNCAGPHLRSYVSETVPCSSSGVDLTYQLQVQAGRGRNEGDATDSRVGYIPHAEQYLNATMPRTLGPRSYE